VVKLVNSRSAKIVRYQVDTNTLKKKMEGIRISDTFLRFFIAPVHVPVLMLALSAWQFELAFEQHPRHKFETNHQPVTMAE